MTPDQDVVVLPSLGHAGSHKIIRETLEGKTMEQEDCQTLKDAMWGLYAGPTEEPYCVVPAPIGKIVEIQRDPSTNKLQAKIEMNAGYRARNKYMRKTDATATDQTIKENEIGNWCLEDKKTQSNPLLLQCKFDEKESAGSPTSNGRCHRLQ